MDYLQESIDKIVAFAKKEAAQYGLMDQATIYQELVGKMDELNQKALMDEYMNGVRSAHHDDDYLLDGG